MLTDNGLPTNYESYRYIIIIFILSPHGLTHSRIESEYSSSLPDRLYIMAMKQCIFLLLLCLWGSIAFKAFRWPVVAPRTARLYSTILPKNSVEEELTKQIYCNVELNGNYLDAVGFDMDFTLAQVREESPTFSYINPDTYS